MSFPQPPPTSLSLPVRLGRGVALGLTAGLMGLFLIGGTPESRTSYLVSFFLGFLNPLWALWGMALLGGFFLIDQGHSHWLVLVDVLALGALAGELRRAGRPGATPAAGWGAWPALAVGMLLLLAASAYVSLRFSLLHPDRDRPDRFLMTGIWTFYSYTTEPEWGLRCLANWTIGLSLAAVAARRASRELLERLLLFGAVGLVAACAVGWLERLDWVSLYHYRRLNPDPLQVGRFQGVAGHAGWLGEWIALLWPGLVLALVRAPGRWGKALVAAAAGFVGMCLLLTAARAAWLGVLVGMATGGLLLARSQPGRLRAVALWTAAGTVVAVGVALALGGEVLQSRFEHLLRVTDRLNYVTSALLMIREHPLGVGLGMHYHTYSDWFSPLFRAWQTDHVTSHNLPLHFLAENGPMALLALLAAIGGLAWEAARAWGRLDAGRRLVLALALMGLTGLLVEGIAQYIFYLRSVEYTAWILFGAVLGLCRQVSPTSLPLPAAARPVVLTVCVVGALYMAAAHQDRPSVESLPGYWDVMPDTPVVMVRRWTPQVYRFPVDPDVTAIAFALQRSETPAMVHIAWGDGTEQTLEVQPGEALPVTWEGEALASPGLLAPARWVTIRTSSTDTPARWHPWQSTDRRALGVEIIGMTWVRAGAPAGPAAEE